LRKISQGSKFGPVTGQKPTPEGEGKSGLRYAGLGVQLAASILVFVLAGQWLDRKLGTDSWFTIGLALLGFGGTFYSLIRQLNKDAE
jgi:F0F1-type ATP synthase assembly protein I